MRRTLVIALGAISLLSACSDGRDALMGKAVRNMEEQVALLASVTDGDAAAKAVPRAKVLASEARELQARIRETPARTPEEQARVVGKYGERLKAVMDGLAVERKRIAVVPGGKDVLVALRAE